MHEHLVTALDYPKSAFSSLEQARLNQATQVVMSPTLHENNLQLTVFNSIIHQQHNKVWRYNGYFISKEK